MNTKQLRQKILDLAIRGQLVPQDISDEPASVLLEKIRAEKQTLIEQKKIKKDKKSSYITCDLSPYQKYTEHFADGSSKDITDEIPFDIPENWAWCRLGEITMINPKNNIEDNKEVSFIPMTLISDGFSNKHSYEVRLWGEVKKGFTHFQEGDIGVAKITPCFENSSAKLVPKGTLLLAMYGSIGKLGIAGMPLATNQAIAFALENKEINTKYLFYYLLSVRSSLNLLGKGATQKNISQSIIKDFHFPLPPLAEQHRIVAKIEHIFAVLDELEENIL